MPRNVVTRKPTGISDGWPRRGKWWITPAMNKMTIFPARNNNNKTGRMAYQFRDRDEHLNMVCFRRPPINRPDRGGLNLRIRRSGGPLTATVQTSRAEPSMTTKRRGVPTTGSMNIVT